MFTKPTLVLTATIWLPLIGAVSVLSLLIYVAVQQDYRMSANDPQIQVAEDAATRLSANAAFSTVVPTEQVDLAASLSPFIIVFDSNGKPLASSGVLNNQTPTPPLGVLTSATKDHENRVTWKPQTGVRIAAVVTAYSASSGKGYVLVGRSLREVEKRESNLFSMVAIVWLVTAAASLVLTLLLAGARERTA